MSSILLQPARRWLCARFERSAIAGAGRTLACGVTGALTLTLLALLPLARAAKGTANARIVTIKRRLVIGGNFTQVIGVPTWLVG